MSLAELLDAYRQREAVYRFNARCYKATWLRTTSPVRTIRAPAAALRTYPTLCCAACCRLNPTGPDGGHAPGSFLDA